MFVKVNFSSNGNGQVLKMIYVSIQYAISLQANNSSETLKKPFRLGAWRIMVLLYNSWNRACSYPKQTSSFQNLENNDIMDRLD